MVLPTSLPMPSTLPNIPPMPVSLPAPAPLPDLPSISPVTMKTATGKSLVKVVGSVVGPVHTESLRLQLQLHLRKSKETIADAQCEWTLTVSVKLPADVVNKVCVHEGCYE